MEWIALPVTAFFVLLICLAIIWASGGFSPRSNDGYGTGSAYLPERKSTSGTPSGHTGQTVIISNSTIYGNVYADAIQHSNAQAGDIRSAPQALPPRTRQALPPAPHRPVVLPDEWQYLPSTGGSRARYIDATPNEKIVHYQPQVTERHFKVVGEREEWIDEW